jgi:hypothetical protein
MSAATNPAREAPVHAAGAVPGSPPAAPEPALPRPSPLRRCFRQRPWISASTALIALGAFMLMQPFSLSVYSYSFVVLLAGVIGFTIAGKLPE